MNKPTLQWHTARRRVNDLLPHPKNPRKLDDQQRDALMKSLKKFGLAEIPAINTDNQILAGHQRIKVLQLLGRGEELIDVRIPSRPLTKKEADQYLLTSNAVHGSWDFELLKAFPTDLILDIGFSESDIAGIFDDALEAEDDNFDEEKELAKIKKPKTKVGEIYALGPHRLAVGDSTDPALLKKLFGNEKASAIYSDPVYNLRGGVDYAKGVGGKAHYGGEHVNDNRTDDEYKEFLRKGLVSALAVAKDDVHIFYYCDASYVWLLQTLYRELGIDYKRTCLWIKNGLGLTPGVAFNKIYEPAIYGVRGKPLITKGIENLSEIMNKEIGTGNRALDDILDGIEIWLAKRLPGNLYQHATSKPPSLHEHAIRRCTKVNDIILDSFCGSGSTLISGHQLKRRVYTVDLEPVFCDLTIARFEKFNKHPC